MKKNRGVSMITVVITIVVLLILALIAFGRSDQLIGNTDYSKFVNNVNEVGFAFGNAAVDIQGSSMLVNNKKRDEQIYNFIAKGGEKERDFLIMSKVPDYTIIQDSADIGMDLPEMKIESGTGKMVAAKYVTSKTGQVFVWPPFEHEGKLYITDTDTVDHKMQTNIIVGGEDIVIELDPIWGSIVDIVIEQEEIPDYEAPEEEGHEHDFSAKEATEFYFFAEATCTTSEKYYYKCLYCEEKGTQTYNWGNPLDHTFGEFEVVSEGNCGGAGSKKRVCTRCGFSEFVSIPKNSANHVGGEISEMKTPASCVTAGVEEIKCKTCNVVFRTNTLDKDLNNHVGGTNVKTITAPTCTTTGTQVEKCNSCDKILKTETIDELGHSWGEFIVTVTPNCGNKGTRERTCSTCNAKETSEIDKDLTNHSGGGTEKEIIDATCTKDGENITKCSRCKATLSSTKIAAKGHSFTNKTTTEKYLKSEATCIAAEVYYYKCASCETSAKDSATPEVYTYSSGSLDKTNHIGTIEEHYTVPTATTDGRRWTTCSACGTELSSEVIPCTGAIAVYSDDDKSLRFYKNADLIVAGTAYNGKTVTHVYTGFEEEKYTSADLVPWSAIATKVTSVVVSNEINPISLAYWFENFVNASTFDVEKINTTNVTNLTNTFKSAGYNVSSFKITGLNNWNVQKVISMSEMFQYAGRNATTFDIGDLSAWKTTSVTHTLGMFYIAGFSADTFDVGNLDNWDVSKVTNMTCMFYRAGQGAKTWNVGDLSKWNTSSAIHMANMFDWAGYNATTFDIGNLSKWNTANVTNMGSMFRATGYSAKTWNIGDLSNWDTSKVTNMTYMFSRAGHSAKTWDIGDLSNWKTSNVTDMSYMFHSAGYSASTWSIGDLSNWDTSKVTNMAGMFAWCGYSAATFDIGNLSKWNTANVTNMMKMFDYAGHNSTPITLDLSGWDTSKVTHAKDASGDVASGMVYMLNNVYRLHTITLGENFSTTGDGTCTGFALPVIDRNYFTESDGKWYDIGTGIGYEPDEIPTNTAATYSVMRPEPILAASSTWYTQGGTTINRNQISSITIVDTYDVTGKTIIDQWDASQVSEGASDNIGPVTAYVENDGLGKGTYKLTLAGDGAGKVYANPDSSYVFGTTKENSGDAFINMTSFNGGEIFDTSRATTLEYAVSYATSLKNIDVENWDVSAVTNMKATFVYCKSVEKLDVGNWDTSKVTSMYGTFQNCTALTELDVATKTVTVNGKTYIAWNTANVISFHGMFASRSNEFLGKITKLEVENWDTSSAENMHGLFNGCASLTSLDLSNWNTSKVTDMAYMFADCINMKEYNLSGWDTSNVTTFDCLFNDNRSIVILDVSDFDTENVVKFTQTFELCMNLEEIIGLENWDTSSGRTMFQMFHQDHKLKKLNLSSFDTSSLVNICQMFGNCHELETIYVSEKWDMSLLSENTFVVDDVTPSGCMHHAFWNCYKLVGGAGTAYSEDHLSYSDRENSADYIYAHIDGGIENPGYLTDISKPIEPILAENSTWFDQGGTTINRNQISSVTIANTYDVTGKTIVDQWDASIFSYGTADDNGPVTAYVENDGLGKGTYKLTIAGNGAGKVYANPDSSYAFGTTKEESGDAFINMTSFNGGEIFDTSRATTLEYAVSYATSLKNIDVENWDVSAVTNMKATFVYCKNVEKLDVGNWDTSKVTSMYGTFQNCTALTELDVATKTVTANGKTYTAWDTSNVKDFSGLFATESNKFAGKITKLEVENWDTSSAETMRSMFRGCSSLTELDLSNWNVSKVTSMVHMFSDCINMKEYNFTGWDTSSLVESYSMFNDNKAIEILDVSDFDMGKVTYFSQMFEQCDSLKEIKGLENWDTSSVVGLFQMFAGSENLTELDLSSFDTSNVTSISQAFRSCYNLEKIYVSDKWDMSSLVDEDFISDETFETGKMKHAFEGCTKLVGGAGTAYATEHVDYVTDARDAKYAHIDEGSSNPGYLTDIEMKSEPVLAANSTWYTQGGSTIARNQISSITIADTYNTTGKTVVDQWDASQLSKGASDNIGPVTAYVEDDGLGNGTYKLTLAGNGTGKVYANLDSSFVFGAPEESSGDSFTNMTAFNNAEIFDTSKATTFERAFTYAKKLESINVANWDISNVTNLYIMFGYCTSLKELDLTNWDVGNVTNMRYTFGSPNIDTSWDMQLTTIGDTSNWDTSNVTTMHAMFQGCVYLESVNVANWDTSKVQDMGYLFRGCESLEQLDIANWKTDNVETMRSMFEKCNKVAELNLENWDTSKVTDMSFMFSKCESLAELDLSSWNVSNVELMYFMFQACTNLINLNIEKWDTSNVIDMCYMFSRCDSIIELDLSSFDTSSVFNMGKMFESCDVLETIYVSDKWDVSNLSSDTFKRGLNSYCQGNTNLFLNSPCLVGGAGTTYADNHLDYSTNSGDYIYAHIDEGTSNPGYLTDISAKTAFAVYSATDNSLRFYKDLTIPTAGSTYEGRVATNVYTGFEDTEYAAASNVPWYANRGNVKTVVVEDVVSPVSTDYWFHGLTNATSMDLAKLDTSETVTMHSMFYQAGYNTNDFELTGLENWDTSKVQWMTGMFSQMGYNTTNFSLDLSAWDTGDVEYMSSMFYMMGYNSSEFELTGLSGWDTSSLYATDSMFSLTGYNSSGITLNLSGFNTANVANMSNMFSNMRRLEKITVSANFNFKGNGSTSCTLPVIDTTYFTDADGKWYNLLTKVGYAPASVPNSTAATYVNIKLTTGGDYEVQNKCPKCGAAMVGTGCINCNSSSV